MLGEGIVLDVALKYPPGQHKSVESSFREHVCEATLSSSSVTAAVPLYICSNLAANHGLTKILQPSDDASTTRVPLERV